MGLKFLFFFSAFLFNYMANFKDWMTFEKYLEEKGVTKAITDVLISLLNERPWPQHVYQYIYTKLGDYQMDEINRQLIKLNKKIQKVVDEIKYLKLVRDNNLDYSLYKDFLDRKYTEEQPEQGSKRRKNC